MAVTFPRELLLITPDACSLGQGGQSWPFGGQSLGLHQLAQQTHTSSRDPGAAVAPLWTRDPGAKQETEVLGARGSGHFYGDHRETEDRLVI